ncbi:MAG TPA: DUF1800 domain-containing protein [Candidatus Saccharimonadales bacterium]|nr:DUF1800 domain-containing protein [Candidatus Saccharimonadales bacterium]
MLKPLDKDKWSFEMAAHLLNRAGFGGPPSQIQKLADLTHDAAISSLLDYDNIYDATVNPDWAHPNPDEIKQLREALKAAATPEEKRQIQQAANKVRQTRFLELRGWWLQRMARGPRPFQERMVLFWHGHFATSAEKVQNPYYMWRQNELFRRLATGNWQLLLTEAGQDPAMLVWLDQAQSRKEHPNENFAREVMELFALGEGHYTEHDITEGARALTGWSLDQDNQKFIYRPRIHDDGEKTFLGRTGDLDGDDVIATIVGQPQAAKFITAKLWNYFAGQMPDEPLNEALASVFRANGNNFRPFLRVMFRSEEFYGADIVRNQVKSPVQWLIGSVRMLECDLPPTLVSWGMLRQLGQDVFAPPNVKGWDGGITWITTNTLLTRYNDAQSLVQGTLPSLNASDFAQKAGGQGGQKLEKAFQRIRMGGVNVEKILTPEERADKDTIVASLQHRLFQTTLHENQQEALQQFLDSKTKMSDADITETIRLMMSTPEYQVT